MSLRNTIFVIAGIVVLGVLWYGLSPLFISIKADDPLPINSEELPAEEAGEETGTENLPTIAVGEPAPGATDAPAKPEAPVEPKLSPVVGTAGHPASGFVRVVEADGKAYVRYEDFKTINGPDLFVYLAKDKDAKEFVNLGELKATEGNVNYEVPEGVNVSEYPYVLTWCRAFGVLFNSAEL